MSTDVTTGSHTTTPRQFERPALITFRYKCDCVGREVLAESLVIDLDMPEDVFIWTMKRVRENMLREIATHLEKQE